jgi:hypothetical protein
MITVSVVAAITYKNLGVSDADIAFHAGFMYLPWTRKPPSAPVVEMFRAPRSSSAMLSKDASASPFVALWFAPFYERHAAGNVLAEVVPHPG